MGLTGGRSNTVLWMHTACIGVQNPACAAGACSAGMYDEGHD